MSRKIVTDKLAVAARRYWTKKMSEVLWVPL